MCADRESAEAATAAAELFLRRRLYQRVRDGSVMHPSFVELHYPCYWHYDVLFGLLIMAESGQIDDERCGAALTLVESKRLPDGGFPAEHRYYRPTRKSRRRMNPWVSARAAVVLHAAGRSVDGADGTAEGGSDGRRSSASRPQT